MLRKPNRPLIWMYVLVLIASALAVFGRVVHYEFLTWDDDVHITENPHFHPVSPSSVLTFWRGPYEGLYIPLSYTVFAAEAAVARTADDTAFNATLDPRVFHTGNLLLHILCGLLVYAILRELIRNDAAACCGGLLFCLHPVQVESVAWISETRGLLSAAFSLLAIWSFVRFTTAATAGQRSRRYTGASIFYVLAMLAKPTAVAVPLIVCILDRWWLDRPWRKTLLAVIPWCAVAAAFTFFTKLEQTNASLAYVPPMWSRPLIAGDALAFYFSKLLLPIDLAFDYGRRPELIVQSAGRYAGWVIPAAVILAGLLWRLAGTAWGTGLGIWIAGVAPALGFIPFAFQRISTVADRYQYVALLGWALIAAAAMARCRHRVVYVVIAVWLVALSFVSTRQSEFWRDDAALYRRGLEVNPQSFIAHNNLGNRLLREGNLDSAVEHFHQALFINPAFADGHYNLGLVHAQRNELGAAVDRFQTAIRLREQRYGVARAQTHFDLGAVFEKQQKFDEAEREYRTAIHIMPRLARAHFGLGNVLHARGAIDEAVRRFHTAVFLRPDYVDARICLADMLLLQRQFEEAVTHYEAVLDSGHPNLPRVRLNLALVSAGSGDVDGAVGHLELAVHGESLDADLSSRIARVYYDLAEKYQQQGEMQRAVDCLRKAIRLVPSNSEPALEIRQRMDHYQTGR